MSGADRIRCPRCGHEMLMRDGSDRTLHGVTYFTLFCERCGHVESDSVRQGARLPRKTGGSAF